MNHIDNHTQYYIIVFNSKNHAYFLESILNKLGHKSKLLQVPTYLSKSCNMGIIVYTEEVVNIALQKIKASRLDVYRIYINYYDKSKNKKVFKVIQKG